MDEIILPQGFNFLFHGNDLAPQVFGLFDRASSVTAFIHWPVELSNIGCEKKREERFVKESLPFAWADDWAGKAGREREDERELERYITSRKVMTTTAGPTVPLVQDKTRFIGGNTSTAIEKQKGSLLRS